MCGRYTLTYADLGAIVAALDAIVDPAAAELYRPRYNIAPSNAVVVARGQLDRPAIVPAVWGLRRDHRLIVNARSESASGRFPGAYQRGRCVVPADGFYEWTGELRDRRAIWFHASDGAPLLMAGLLDEGAPPAFAVLTAPARPPVATIHDRMPVLLSREGARRWLLGEAPRAVTPDEIALEGRPVSPRVNATAHDDPGLSGRDGRQRGAARAVLRPRNRRRNGAVKIFATQRPGGIVLDVDRGGHVGPGERQGHHGLIDQGTLEHPEVHPPARLSRGRCGPGTGLLFEQPRGGGGGRRERLGWRERLGQSRHVVGDGAGRRRGHVVGQRAGRRGGDHDREPEREREHGHARRPRRRPPRRRHVLMRPLRALFFANDGLGAGHLARTLAIARALRRRVERLEVLVATTSEADALLAAEGIAAVRWPTPRAARESGWSDAARREMAAHVVRGVIEGARPDLLVTDTFPSGPHGELGGLVREVPRRVLVRRSVRPERAGETPLRAGLADYDVAIVPDDPGEHRTEELPIPAVRVPPITLFEAHEAVDRDTARARLGLPREGRLILVCSGGGGDGDAGALAARVAESIARIPGGPTPVLAVGPLSRGRLAGGGAEGVLRVRETPLQPLLAAFDGAVAPAGYNVAHELAKAGVPAALFAMPRPFDDQAGRAARFEAAGIGRALPAIDDAGVAAAVAWMAVAPRPSIAPGGADRAAEALLDLVTKGAA